MQLKKIDFEKRKRIAMEKLPKRGFAKMINIRYPHIKLMSIYNFMNAGTKNLEVLEAMEELAGILEVK